MLIAETVESMWIMNATHWGYTGGLYFTFGLASFHPTMYTLVITSCCHPIV